MLLSASLRLRGWRPRRHTGCPRNANAPLSQAPKTHTSTMAVFPLPRHSHLTPAGSSREKNRELQVSFGASLHAANRLMAISAKRWQHADALWRIRLGSTLKRTTTRCGWPQTGLSHVANTECPRHSRQHKRTNNPLARFPVRTPLSTRQDRFMRHWQSCNLTAL